MIEYIYTRKSNSIWVKYDLEEFIEKVNNQNDPKRGYITYRYGLSVGDFLNNAKKQGIDVNEVLVCVRLNSIGMRDRSSKLIDLSEPRSTYFSMDYKIRINNGINKNRTNNYFLMIGSDEEFIYKTTGKRGFHNIMPYYKTPEDELSDTIVSQIMEDRNSSNFRISITNAMKNIKD